MVLSVKLAIVWARMTGPALRVTAIMLGVTELRSREGRGRPVSLEQNMILNKELYLDNFQFATKP